MKLIDQTQPTLLRVLHKYHWVILY